MNLYFLVEGDRTETKLYRHWIRHALPHLSEVDLAADLTGDRFYIISGGGYPSYVDRIRDSLLDLKDHSSVDHFFICIDSEELSYAEKLAEIVDELARAERGTRVRDCNPHFRSHVIVQHCCAETWFLGHRTMMTRNPTSPDLLRFQRFFDVRTADPEGMGRLPGYVTRASFHLAYLKAMLVEKNPGSTTPSGNREKCWSHTISTHFASAVPQATLPACACSSTPGTRSPLRKPRREVPQHLRRRAIHRLHRPAHGAAERDLADADRQSLRWPCARESGRRRPRGRRPGARRRCALVVSGSRSRW